MTCNGPREGGAPNEIPGIFDFGFWIFDFFRTRVCSRSPIWESVVAGGTDPERAVPAIENRESKVENASGFHGPVERKLIIPWYPLEVKVFLIVAWLAGSGSVLAGQPPSSAQSAELFHSTVGPVVAGDRESRAAGNVSPTILRITGPSAPNAVYARMADALRLALVEAKLAKEVNVDYAPGDGGVIGLNAFAREARGDGSRLLVTGDTTIASILLKGSPVTLADVTPIARLTSDAGFFAVRRDSTIRNARDWADAMRADVTKVRIGAGSIGGAGHLTLIAFAMIIGVEPARLNYSVYLGRDSTEALLAGKVDVAMVSDPSTYQADVDAGRIRLIATTAAERVPGVECPTFREHGIDLVVSYWRGLVAAPGISDQQRSALLRLVDELVRSPAWSSMLKKRGWTDAYLAGDDFSRYIQSEQKRLDRTYRAIGLIK
jgi:putative tricarboxylic transport membrane protein